jgi:hypothetical protein
MTSAIGPGRPKKSRLTFYSFFAVWFVNIFICLIHHLGARNQTQEIFLLICNNNDSLLIFNPLSVFFVKRAASLLCYIAPAGNSNSSDVSEKLITK